MNKILVPIDFEPQSLIALEQSYNLARLLPAEIILLYIIASSSGLSGLFGSNNNDSETESIQQKLDLLSEKVRKETGLNTTTLIEKGKVHQKILDVSEQLEVGFIIMGTHSKPLDGREEEAVPGANSSRVVRSSKCPVITINGAHHYKGCRNILLPLDLTSETRQKVNYAIQLAKLYGAGIKVVSAMIKNNDQAATYKLKLQIDQVYNFISEAGVGCTTEIIDVVSSKLLVPSIIRYAENEGDIDLIVIMTQQEQGLLEYFVGSHARDLIRLSTMPVMSILPKQLGFTSIFS